MKKLLLNPFERFAGTTALVMGLAVIVITALIAWLGKVHLDGPVDLHAGARSLSFRACIAEGIVDWLTLAILLYAAGAILSRSSIRLVDVLGTQALARFPYLIVTGLSTLLFSDKISTYIEFKFLHQGTPVEIGAAEIISFGIMTLAAIACLIWMLIWMYRAYSISANIKGTKGIISFIACILLAEVASKLLISAF